MIPTGMPHGYGWAITPQAAPAEPPIVKEPPVIMYDAPCDLCGRLCQWRTVLVGSTAQETHCDCTCVEVAA